MKRIATLAVIGFLVCSASLATGKKRKGGQGGGGEVPNVVDQLPLQEVDRTERADVVYLREGEKVARDVYMALHEKWGLKVFDNIEDSEQNHMDAVGHLLERNEIEDPVGDNGAGVFTNEDLQRLYLRLLLKGLQSRDDAITVGAIVEDKSVFDLQEMLKRTDNLDFKVVYESLLRGSRNHLRAFHRQLTKYDLTYTPNFITQDEYNEIVSTPAERQKRRGRS
jgi:hypothetical protein